MYKIWHIGAWNRNIGDWAACYNLQRRLEALGASIGKYLSFYPVDSQRGVFHDAIIDQINDDMNDIENENVEEFARGHFVRFWRARN